MVTHVTQADYWRLMNLKKTTGDSSVSARLMDTHETQGDFLGLMRILILIKTKRDSWGLMRLWQTKGDS